jgi:hypothetical protein
VEFLNSAPKQPFFLDVGFFDTHRPYRMPGPEDDYRYTLPPPVNPDTPQTRQDMARFNATARKLDEGVGMVLDALEKNGFSENTLVISTTDHGIAFPDMKCFLYDHGMGVSLIIRRPGGFIGGQVCDALISQIDVFPIMCDYLAIDPPPWLQGKSFLPIIQGRAQKTRDEVVAEVNFHVAYEPKRRVRTERWKYIRLGQTFKMTELEQMTGCKTTNAPHPTAHAHILNGYGWLWLNRDGTPTQITREVWEKVAPGSTAEERFKLNAYLLAGLTEFHRAHRHYAALLYFVYLTGNFPNDMTSDFQPAGHFPPEVQQETGILVAQCGCGRKHNREIPGSGRIELIVSRSQAGSVMKFAKARKSIHHRGSTQRGSRQKGRDSVVAGPSVHAGALIKLNGIDVILDASQIGGGLPAGIVEIHLTPRIRNLGADLPIPAAHQECGGDHREWLRNNLNDHPLPVGADRQFVAAGVKERGHPKRENFRMNFGARILLGIRQKFSVQVNTDTLRSGDVQGGRGGQHGYIKTFAEVHPMTRSGRQRRRGHRRVPDVVFRKGPM